MNFLLVGTGAAMGALIRYSINLLFEKLPHPYPFATQIINLSGAFLLGIFAGMNLSNSLYLLLGTGLMGGYTTFSTLNFELFILLKENRKLFYWYFAITYVVGIVFCFAGLVVGKILA
ncbi:fluoride efflux transporter FluC [Enterococcus sp. LJL120]